jgi:hypothetical protein
VEKCGPRRFRLAFSIAIVDPMQGPSVTSISWIEMKQLGAPVLSLLALIGLTACFPIVVGASAIAVSHPAPAALGVPPETHIELRLERGQTWNGKSSPHSPHPQAPNHGAVSLQGSSSGSHPAQAIYDRAGHTLTIGSPRLFLPGETIRLVVPRRDGFSGAVLSFQVAAGPAAASFEPRDRLAVSSSPNMLVAADLDADGDCDLAVSEVLKHDGIHVFLNDGFGRFSALDIITVPGIEDPARFALSDLDRDGHLDLVVVGESSANLVVLRGQGDGGFEAGPVRELESGTPVQAVAGDLNLDGYDDVIVAHLGSADRLTLLQGEPIGGRERERRVRVGRGVQSLVLVDLDADGHLDLATANQETDQLSILRGEGDGRLDPAVTLATGGRPEAVVAADLSGDGIMDLVSVNQGTNDVSVFLGRGELAYEPPVSFATGDRPFIPALGDLDGDGDLDLAVPGLFSDDVSVLRNEGRGTFVLRERLAVDPGPVAVAAADFDGNGTLDLAVASSVGDNVRIWANMDLQSGDNPASSAVTGLAQNVPNPFNPATEIAYTLARPGFVGLVVFNTSGKVVRTLVHGFEAQGSHLATWDGLGDGGDKLPSGIYFYRLTTEETVELRRMTLLR